MAKNGKDANNIRHIARRVNFVRNGGKFKMHQIDWCEGDLQLADIATNSFGENYLNDRMKYSTVRLNN